MSVPPTNGARLDRLERDASDIERRLRSVERAITMAYGAVALVALIGLVNLVQWLR